MPKKVVIDVDTGIDDSAALILALCHPDVEVLGVTCVSGNVHVDNVIKNTVRVLEVCDRLDVSAGVQRRGQLRSLLPNEHGSVFYHGEDGLGEVEWPGEPINEAPVKSEHAVIALIRLINAFPGEVSVVAVGPLTNLALALKVDPDLGKKVKSVMVMGGNHHGIGNVTPSAEFNFGGDPEAASICLHELKNVNIVTWETCMDAEFPWNIYDKWIHLNTKKSNFVKNITSYWVVKKDFRNIRNGILLCDLYAMAAFLDESAILEKTSTHVLIELHGRVTRGQMVVDWDSKVGKPPNATVVTKISVEVVAEMFEKALRM